MNLRIAVRELCELAAKEGDLDLRFTPSPTAQEGMAGHATVVARRGPDYVAELPLIGAVRGADGQWPRRWLRPGFACWKRSRPTAATSRASRPTTACCTGRR